MAINEQTYRGGDLFDLVAEAEDAYNDLRRLVLPAQELSRSLGQMGKRFQPKAGLGINPLSPREYSVHRGDVPSMIHARLSSRLPKNEAVVVERETERKHDILIHRNASRSMDYASRPDLPTKKVAAETMALATLMQLAKHEDNVGVIHNNRRYILPRNASHAADRLANLSILTGEQPHIPKGVPARSDIILFDDFYDLDDTLRALDDMYNRKMNVSLMTVIDPREVAFDFPGAVQIHGDNGQLSAVGDSKLVFHDPQAAVEVLHEETFKHRSRLQQEVCDRGFSMYLQYTDGDFSEGLRHLLSREPNDVMARLEAPSMQVGMGL